MSDDDPIERLRQQIAAAKEKEADVGDDDKTGDTATSYPPVRKMEPATLPGAPVRDLRSAVMGLITEATLADARVVIAGIDDLEQAAAGPATARLSITAALAQAVEARNALGDLKRTTVEAARLEGRVAALEEALAWVGGGTS